MTPFVWSIDVVSWRARRSHTRIAVPIVIKSGYIGDAVRSSGLPSFPMATSTSTDRTGCREVSAGLPATNDGCGAFTRQTPRCMWGDSIAHTRAQNNCPVSVLGSQKHALPDFRPNERKLGSFMGSVGRSRRAHGDSPLDLHRMPPVALNCGDPPVVESMGDISCGSDALSTQFLNGCHGGFVTHQPCRLVCFVVVHWTFPAGLRASVHPENAPVANLIPAVISIPASGNVTRGACPWTNPGVPPTSHQILEHPLHRASSASLKGLGGVPPFCHARGGRRPGRGIHKFRWDRRLPASPAVRVHLSVSARKHSVPMDGKLLS